jgi:phage terminase large subunit GpA-like protein
MIQTGTNNDTKNAISDYRDGYAVVFDAIINGATPLPPMTVSEWADQYRRLPTKGAAEPGRWRTARVPFAKEIMDVLSDHPKYAHIQRVVFKKPTQVAGTEIGNNWVGSVMSRMKVPMMVIQPTIDLAERWSKQRLAAMIEDTPCLRALIAPSRSRDSGNTTLLKEWPGGVLIVSGANSSASLRSMPARYLFADEVDAYPLDLDGEGDPLSLAEARTSTFAAGRKLFICSTPTIKTLSVIDREYEQSDQRRYHLPCPHCLSFQPLVWDHLHWQEGNPHAAVYVCAECGAEIREHHKTDMLAAGRWVSENPGSDYAAGFHLNSLYTPIGLGLSWGELAAIWEKVHKDPIKLKAFVNTKLGECNEDPDEKIDWEELQHRKEPYRLRTVPLGCLVITAGIDVQGNRWAILLLGHGRSNEQWIIDYVEIDGDPSKHTDWQRVDDYLSLPIVNSYGVPIHITSVAVDAGYLQDDVLYFTRYREARGIFAIKGANTPGKPIIGRPTKVDFNWRGSVIKHGAMIWMVGEDSAKSRLFQALIADRSALTLHDRRLHFSIDLDESFFSGLTAEIYDPNKRRWVKVRQRNEPLDCYGYALAASMHPRHRVHQWTDAQWERQRQALEPVNGDLFSSVAQAPATPNHESIPDEAEIKETPPPAQKRKPPARSNNGNNRNGFGKPGWVNSWR